MSMKKCKNCGAPRRVAIMRPSGDRRGKCDYCGSNVLLKRGDGVSRLKLFDPGFMHQIDRLAGGAGGNGSVVISEDDEVCDVRMYRLFERGKLRDLE